MALDPARTPDAIFFGDSATDTETELLDDDSQEATDLTSGGVGSGYVYANATARFAPDNYTEFSVAIGVTMSNATVGTFWSYGGTLEEVRISGGVITVRWNNTSIITYTVTNISASTESFLIMWAAEPNTALTTGAADTYRGELTVINLTQDTVEQARVTMDDNVGGTTWDAVYGARTNTGTNVFGGTLTDLGFYRTFHTATWAYENFKTATTAPTLAGEERLEVHVPARSTGIGDDGQLAGPPLLLGAAQANQSDLRLVGPLVNKWYGSSAPELSIPVTDDSPWHLETTDGTDALLYKAYLYRRPVPNVVNKARVRVFFQMYRTDGAAADTLTVYVYSMSQPGHLYKPQWSPPEMESYYVSKAYTTSHGSGANDGVWCDFDDATLPLARDEHDYTYLCLGFKVVDAGGAATPENQLFKFRALVVEPIYSLAEDGLNLGGG